MTASIIGLCIPLLRCQPEHATPPTVAGHVNAGAARLASVLERSRLAHGRADMAWVADLHTRAMQQWMEGRATMHGLPAAEACARLAGVVRSYFPEAKKATHIPDNMVFERALAEEQAVLGCGARHGPAAGLALLTVADAGDGPVVTGAYEPYLPMLQAAVANAATPEAAVAAVDAVLMQASDIPDPDFEVLSAAASVAASSACYWGEQAGDLGNPYAMSLFMRKTFSWRNFAGADIGGALATVAFLRTIGAVHPYLIAAGLFGGAAVASGYYAYQNS